MSRIALIGDNSVEYIELLLKIWRDGDTAVLLDWRIPPSSAIEMMREARVCSCYIEKSLFSNFDFLCNEISFITFQNKTKSATILPDFLYDSFVVNYSKDEAVILYSSGTTGKSKGIILSHYAIQTNADAIIDYMCPTAKDCIYIVKTLSHSSTLVGELLIALKTKTKLLIGPVITLPRVTMNNLSRFGVTILCVNPTLLKMYADEVTVKEYDLKDLKTIYVSGSILNDSIYEYAHHAFQGKQIYNVYGLSEAGPRVTAQKVDCCRSNSVGTPIKGVRIAIVDDQGNHLSVGQRGSIHVKTSSLFDGYVKGTLKHASKYMGWLNTGDIGYLDENRELHVIGRSDDVIIIDAHKIYPQDIETAIYNIAKVKECVVTALMNKGNLILCCVYVSEADLPIDIRKKLGKVLIRYEIPKVFVRMKDIPKTKTGKPLVREIKIKLGKIVKGELIW